MKRTDYLSIVFIAILLATVGCASNRSSTAEINFDQIVHFKYDKEKFGEVDFGAVSVDDPTPLLVPLADNSFANLSAKLERHGFDSSEVDEGYFPEINALFDCEEYNGPRLVAECIPVYRDILVFRKSERIIKVAQICFDCDKIEFIGDWQNAGAFGQRGEFQKLENLLNK